MAFDHPDEEMGLEQSSSSDVPVALDTLAADDGTRPDVGDEVEVSVVGKVSRIDEETNCAYVTCETCNGVPPPAHGGEDSGESLREAGQSMDDSTGYPI